MDANPVGSASRRPESVAEDRRTPWKNRGLEICQILATVRAYIIKFRTYTLKRIDVCRMHPIKFENTRFPCGDFRTRCGGMMGLVAFDSTRRKIRKDMRKTMREMMINGCDPRQCQPTRAS